MCLFTSLRAFRRRKISFVFFTIIFWIFLRNGFFLSHYWNNDNLITGSKVRLVTGTEWNLSTGNLSAVNVKHNGLRVPHGREADLIPNTYTEHTNNENSSKFSRNHIVIGVFANKNRGKWENKYICPGSGIYVQTIQNDDFSLLNETDALYFPGGSLTFIEWDKLPA